MITAKVVCDSISPQNIRLVTFQLRFPRIILAEVNTHGALAKNARSTRAVPTTKLIAEVRDNPFVPIKWGMNNPGMQSKSEIVNEECVKQLEEEWRYAARNAALHAERLFAMKLHKQHAGRVLEPFMWVDSVVSATDWANFFALRDHPDAQPEFEQLAKTMRIALAASTPKLLQPGQWHLPYFREVSDNIAISEYFGDGVTEEIYLDTAKKLSVARCARVSYAPFDGDGSIAKELERYKLLVESKPVHSSPTEHQATPDGRKTTYYDSGVGGVEYAVDGGWLNTKFHGRFTGWCQFRKMIADNTVLDSWNS